MLSVSLRQLLLGSVLLFYSLIFAQKTAKRTQAVRGRRRLNAYRSEGAEGVLGLRDLVCCFFFLGHLLALTMARHPSMELPAHLSVSFLDCEFPTALIKVLQLYTVVYLLACSRLALALIRLCFVE